MSIYLGIDTSNYTTSVAAVGDVFENARKVIDIKEGMRGIRQSDGVFLHLKELPNLFDSLEIDMKAVSGIGVSTRPRSLDGSYMPVFVAGESFARVVAKSLGVPLFKYSHQDGHIMSGILSQNTDKLLSDRFLAVHMSGGTTEILNCRYTDNRFDCEIVGGTKDISAGQLIDRIGVLLGMKFPCGAEMDELSLLCTEKPMEFKTSVKEGYINFSGIETKLLKLKDKTDKGMLAKTALNFIGKSISEAVNFNKPKNVLFVGGVASNTLLREYFKENIDAKIYFASRELSCDNAVGIAELCRRAFL